MCSLNMGSMNFALFPMLDRPTRMAARLGAEAAGSDARHDLQEHLRRHGDASSKRLGEGCGTRFEFECYDVGHLYSLAHFRDRGLVSGPLFIQFVFGILGGIGADPENLAHMKRIADKLFGDDYQFSVLAAGRHQMPMISMAAAMGGNVRVGLEDSLYDGRASWRNPMPTRCAASAPSSRRCRWRSPRPPRRAKCWRSRAATGWRFERMSCWIDRTSLTPASPPQGDGARRRIARGLSHHHPLRDGGRRRDHPSRDDRHRHDHGRAREGRQHARRHPPLRLRRKPRLRGADCRSRTASSPASASSSRASRPGGAARRLCAGSLCRRPVPRPRRRRETAAAAGRQ